MGTVSIKLSQKHFDLILNRFSLGTDNFNGAALMQDYMTKVESDKERELVTYLFNRLTKTKDKYKNHWKQ